MRQKIFAFSLWQNNKTDINVTSEAFIAQKTCRIGYWFGDFSILKIVYYLPSEWQPSEWHEK